HISPSRYGSIPGNGEPIGLVVFDAVGPVFGQLFGRRHFERTNNAEAEELRVRVVPDAFGELRVLHFPGGAGSASGRAAQTGGIIIPGTTARNVTIRLGGPDP